MGCHMFLKMHFLHLHLEFFPENLGAIDAEQGEIFQKDIQAMDEKYQWVWNEDMMGNFCWVLVL